MLVVGPNETFIRYIEQVLPALGEGGVEQRPIGSLIAKPHGEVDETRELAALKGSARIAVVLHRLLWDRLKLEDVEIPVPPGDVTVTADELRELVAAVRERTFSYEAGRERFRERLAGLLAARALDARLAGQPGGGDQRRAQDEASTRRWRARRGRARRREGLVGEAVQEPRAAGARWRATCSSRTRSRCCSRSSAAVKRRDMTPTDVALLDEAHWLIDPGFRRFGHVVVDEAQNLTPMELRMTVRRARGQSLTILGDLSQRTADAGVSSWERGAATRRAWTTTTSHELDSQLPRAERVPRARGRAAPARRARAARRARGAVPGRRRPHRRRRRRGRARSGAAARRRRGSVGVVAPPCTWTRCSAALGDFADAIHATLGAGINLLDLHVAKGLEFDAIVVVEPAAILPSAPTAASAASTPRSPAPPARWPWSTPSPSRSRSRTPSQPKRT